MGFFEPVGITLQSPTHGELWFSKNMYRQNFDLPFYQDHPKCPFSELLRHPQRTFPHLYWERDQGRISIPSGSPTLAEGI